MPLSKAFYPRSAAMINETRVWWALPADEYCSLQSEFRAERLQNHNSSDTFTVRADCLTGAVRWSTCRPLLFTTRIINWMALLRSSLSVIVAQQSLPDLSMKLKLRVTVKSVTWCICFEISHLTVMLNCVLLSQVWSWFCPADVKPDSSEPRAVLNISSLFLNTEAWVKPVSVICYWCSNVLGPYNNSKAVSLTCLLMFTQR